MDTSQRILSLMVQHGYSYRTLANKLGKNHMTVYNWTHGSPVKEKDLEPLALALKTTPQWLRYGNKLENHELDTALIAHILTLISETSKKQHINIPPKKLAELLTTAYDLVVETGAVDDEMLLRLIKLAK